MPAMGRASWLLGLVCAAGCATASTQSAPEYRRTASLLREMGAAKFRCAAGVTVAYAPPTYWLTGCGQRAGYVCNAHSVALGHEAELRCVLEGSPDAATIAASAVAELPARRGAGADPNLPPPRDPGNGMNVVTTPATPALHH
jgi:hypothetical protein